MTPETLQSVTAAPLRDRSGSVRYNFDWQEDLVFQFLLCVAGVRILLSTTVHGTPTSTATDIIVGMTGSH